jgi:septum formation protein
MVLLEKIRKYKIILGSQSPRRQQILSEAGFLFDVQVPLHVKEEFPPEMGKIQIPVYLAGIKADAIGKLSDNSIVITADTIVWIDGQVLGKPSDAEDAKAMLRQLSGQRHEVLTGVCIRMTDRQMSFVDLTSVWFRKLREEEICWYVEHFKPLDKAGSYGVQEWVGFAGIEKIEGSYFNVMGLPIQRLYVELEKLID